MRRPYDLSGKVSAGMERIFFDFAEKEAVNCTFFCKKVLTLLGKNGILRPKQQERTVML